MHPRPPDAYFAEAVRCACTAGGKPWCARCECLVELALARDVWLYEHVTGLNWWQVMADHQAQEAERMRRIGGPYGLGYTLLGWTLKVLAVGHYVGWTLPHVAWLRYTGQIPRPPLATRLPIRLRERAWCVQCARDLAPGAVRCPEHPQGEVMMVLRDEEGNA